MVKIIPGVTLGRNKTLAAINEANQESSELGQRLINSSLGDYSLDITDPSQIIDPYAYAADYLSDQSVEGKARYLHMLEQGKYIQQMQMAAYENWYNSAEQVAARERSAGLNPDLVGLDAPEAVGAAAPEGSGISSLPTSEQIRTQRIANLTNIISSFGSLVSTGLSAFSSLSILPLQKEALSKGIQLTESQTLATKLGNIANEKGLFQFGIASKLAGSIADAVAAGTESEFDYDSFFGSDLSSVFNTYSSGSPYSQSLFDDVLSNREVLKNEAIQLAKERASGQIDFGKMAGSKYYSDDVVLTAGLLGPLMDAHFQLEENMARYQKSINDIKLKYAQGLDVEGLSDSANRVAAAQGAEADYQQTYLSELDAEQMAAYDFLIKSNEAVKATLDKAINENLKTIYNANKDNIRGFSAAWLYLAGSGSTWSQYLGMSTVAFGLEDINSGKSLFDENGVPVYLDGEGKQPISLGAPSDYNGLGLADFK